MNCWRLAKTCFILKAVEAVESEVLLYEIFPVSCAVKYPSLSQPRNTLNKKSYFRFYIMDNNVTRYNVQLYIYDLSRGMARSLSPIMLGKCRQKIRPWTQIGDLLYMY